MLYSVKRCTLHRVGAVHESWRKEALAEGSKRIMKTERLEFSLLLEFYAGLLSDRQRELVDLYYNDDLSLSEISELTGITRQGVRDGIKKAEGMLVSYEEKLGMYAQYQKRQEDYRVISRGLEGLVLRYGIKDGDADLERLRGLLEVLQQ